MTTILERAKKFNESTSFFNSAKDLVDFATIEVENACERQRELCADSAEEFLYRLGVHVAAFPGLREAILSAGIQPQCPFGCSCWTVDCDGAWYIPVGQGRYNLQSWWTNCPKCGKVRLKKDE